MEKQLIHVSDNFFPAFVVWAKKEMEIFIKIFKRHVFDSKSTFATVAECVSIATNHCQEVCIATVRYL